MICLHCYPGYRPWIRVYGIPTSKSGVSGGSGNGSWGLRNSKDGAECVGKAKAIGQFSSAMEIRASARHSLGNNEYDRGKESGPVLTGGAHSSLVVDRLCDQIRGHNTAVTCFYFDFAARKEQTATSILGSVLKQVISGMERVPQEISRVLQEQKKVVNGRKPQLGDIVKMLQLITSSMRTFMVIDALDECTASQRVKLFDSLKEILAKSSGARIFVTGRPHIRTEIEKRLAGQVTSVSVGPVRDDVINFLRVRLSEDETPDAMDEGLEADILEKIPKMISGM